MGPISQLTGHSAHRSSLCSSEIMSPCLASRPFQVQVPLLPRESKQLAPHLGFLIKDHPLKKPSSLTILSKTPLFSLSFSPAHLLYFFSWRHPLELTSYHMLVLHTMFQQQPQFPESQNCLNTLQDCKKYLFKCIHQLPSTKYLLGVKHSGEHCR